MEAILAPTPVIDCLNLVKEEPCFAQSPCEGLLSFLCLSLWGFPHLQAGSSLPCTAMLPSPFKSAKTWTLGPSFVSKKENKTPPTFVKEGWRKAEQLHPL